MLLIPALVVSTVVLVPAAPGPAAHPRNAVERARGASDRLRAPAQLAAANRTPSGRPARQQGGAQPSSTSDRARSYFLFLQARQSETDGDTEGAIKLYREASTLDPTSGVILAELADLYARQNRLRDAVATAEAALKANPDTPAAHWILGTVYAAYARDEETTANAAARAAEKDYAARAITHLEAVLNARGATADPSLLIMLGRLYLRTSAPEKAIAVMSRFVEQEPDAMDGIALLADAYSRAGRQADAIKLLSQAATREPSFYPPLAALYEQAGRWKDAANAYQKAMDEGTKTPELARRLAATLLNADRPGDAARARGLMQQALKEDPKDTRAMYLLAQAQTASNDYPGAEATARQLIAADPRGAAGPYALAQVYERQHDYRRVVDTLQPVVDRLGGQDAAASGMDVTPLLVHLGFAYLDLEQPDRAIAVLQQAKQRAADDAVVDVGLVQAQIAAKRYAQAADLAHAAAGKYPQDARFVRLEADALRQGGQLDRAVALLEQSRDAHPDDVTTYTALAELLLSGERAGQAEGVLKQARARFPDDLSVLFELGATYDRQKRYDEAEQAFKQVIARDPLHAQALNYLGYMLADRGVRLQESVDYIRRALAVEPNNPAYLDSLGWAYYKMNRLDLAESNLRRAAADRPNDSAVQDHWGDLLLRRGRAAEAVAAWRRALAGDGQDIDRPKIEAKIRSADAKARGK